MGELGYGFAYRILDAQYFGVAQRRRRVFVVGYLGDWRPAAAVLFERHSLQGHSAPSREKRKTIAPSVRTGAANSSTNRIEDSIIVNALCAADMKGVGNQYVSDNKCVVHPSYGIPGNWIGRKPENGGNATEPMFDVAPCLTKADQHGVAQPIGFESSRRDGVRLYDGVSNTLQAFAGTGGGNSPMVAQPIAFSGQMSNPQTDIDMTQTLQAKNPMAVAVDIDNTNLTGDVFGNLCAEAQSRSNKGMGVMQAMAVRRLTPVECERLQGFPDNYTNIKEKCPDGPRYKALGNSMAVPVMAWIGARIQQYEDMQ